MIATANFVTTFESPGKSRSLRAATCTVQALLHGESASPVISRFAEKPPGGGYLVFGFICSAMPISSSCSAIRAGYPPADGSL